VVAHALDRLFSSITYDALQASITGELGSFEALDGFTARTGRPHAFARGVERVTILASDTTIGVAIPPLVFALCAKASVSVKDRSDALTAAFARSLVETLPAFGESLRVAPWTNHHDPECLEAIAQADAVVAFGRDETMRLIREQCKPGARFIPFGHRTSVGYVPREALAEEKEASLCARGAALDALLYDGDGCLSPHAIFVERGASVEPSKFAELLAAACDEIARAFPSRSEQADPRVAAYASRHRFRAAQGNGAVHTGRSGAHLVVFDPPCDEPPPLLPRTIGVYPIDAPEAMLAYVHEHALPVEAVGSSASPRDELIAAFTASGVSRIARLGELQNPPLSGNHGGYGRITPFVSFVYRDG
jgi:hypothetical protein